MCFIMSFEFKAGSRIGICTVSAKTLNIEECKIYR